MSSKIVFPIVIALVFLLPFVFAADNNQIACVTEGASMPVYPGYNCCSGLTGISPVKPTADGICPMLVGSVVCSNCGNGTCESWENSCNCPKDCKNDTNTSPVVECKSDLDCKELACPSGGAVHEICDSGKCVLKASCPDVNQTQTCAGEGEKVYSNSIFSPINCCGKTAGIKPSTVSVGDLCISKTDGSIGTCVNNWWQSCGNGSCETGEDQCNCPADCKKVESDSYRYAKWQCYDGTIESEGGDSSCKSSETWKLYAEEFCAKRCSNDGAKCGVNAFSLSTQCYGGCICPSVYAPVCGVNGKTYSNKCVAACDGVVVAYDGECRESDFKVGIGEKFELKEKQKAFLLDNGEATGVTIALSRINYAVGGKCPEGAKCLVASPTVELIVEKTDGNIGTGTYVFLNEGESKTVFGITITSGYITPTVAGFLTQKSSEPPVETLRVQLDQTFSFSETQTAYIMKGNSDVIKLRFEGVIASACTNSISSSIKPNCGGETYGYFMYSLANPTETEKSYGYLTIRPGATETIGGYEVSLLGLGSVEGLKNANHLAKMVVKSSNEPGTIVVALDQAFDLQKKQKAIVKETGLQLRLVEVNNNIALLEILQPLIMNAVKEPTSSNSNYTINTAAIESTTSSKEIVKNVTSTIAQSKIAVSPMIKLKVGEQQTVYGQTITLNDITGANINCISDSNTDSNSSQNCVSSIMANLTVSKAQEPDTKTVKVGEKFGLIENQTAAVQDKSTVMKIRLLGTETTVCADVNKETDVNIVCDNRPIVKIEVSLPGGCETTSCKEGETCATSCNVGISTVVTMRQGEERFFGNYGLRLLEAGNKKAVFVVNRSIENVIKVNLNEEFSLAKAQTAFVVGESTYIRLEATEATNCIDSNSSDSNANETNCISGDYAKITVWKNPSKYESKSPKGTYRIQKGETIKINGLGITLQALGYNKASFIVTKKDQGVINVQLDEQFSLQERQAANVLGANMRIDLLSILNAACPVCQEGMVCEPCPGPRAEISVSNYVNSVETTGKAVAEKDYISKVIETVAQTVSGATKSEKSNIEMPPTPFRTIMLGSGESAEINDFVIKAVSVNYNSAEFIVSKKGANKEIKIEIVNGWNLISLPGKMETVSSDCNSSDIKILEYVEEQKTFVSVTSEKLGQALWLYYPGEKCSAKGIVREAVTMTDISTVIRGWNFAPVTTDMIGSKVRELAKDCEPKAAFFYNANSRSWENAMDRTLSNSDLGKGFAIYSTQKCRLGGGNATDIPPMPTLPSVEDTSTGGN